MTKQLFAKAATIAMIFAASLLGMSSALAQNAPIRGTVVDAGNEPVIGAAVMVPGTTNGATTNLDGKFELRVAPALRWRFPALATLPSVSLLPTV